MRVSTSSDGDLTSTVSLEVLSGSGRRVCSRAHVRYPLLMEKDSRQEKMGEEGKVHAGQAAASRASASVKSLIALCASTQSHTWAWELKDGNAGALSSLMTGVLHPSRSKKLEKKAESEQEVPLCQLRAR